MDVAIRSSVEFPEGNETTPSWDLDTDIQVTRAWGTLETASGIAWTGCYNNSKICTTSQLADSNAESESLNLAVGPAISKWYTQYVAEMPFNTVRDLYGHLGAAIQVNAPGNPVLLIDHAENTLFGRCDNLSNRFGAGCVDQYGFAYVSYDVRDNPTVKEVAEHVFDSIRTLPSHWGSGAIGGHPLNRITDAAAIDNNRNIACAGVDTKEGESCDEYPLASTIQGGNGASSDDRSIRIVPINTNNSQGGLTSAYYDYYRIHNLDDFYVQAILEDGSTAW
ncbi:NucA/NucB deoxyribonuclease domain-containing protein [Saccharopolyspora spinosa]|uniref:NucA/NucB deoxyribonuclease domain-containing protein n=1 Tax=Saccharopolyspora spinosa TaxID=60894 RepID=UPI001659A6FD|nr:NucA/NucB deoxyribonuclease domain-containing protein [Saccharopolyspora spinosa]